MWQPWEKKNKKDKKNTDKICKRRKKIERKNLILTLILSWEVDFKHYSNLIKLIYKVKFTLTYLL